MARKKKKSKKVDKQKTEIKNIEKHKRVNDILLGFIERPAIQWLVERMPTWVNSDHLTFLGFLAAILIGVSYALTNYDARFLWLASFGFLLNWFGDSLDGNLARYRHQERPKYGFFIDHTIDTVSEVCIFLGFGLSPYVDYNLASLALVGYLCMANLVYITTSVQGEFKISYGSLGPTEVRMIAIISNTVVFFIGNPMLSLPFGQFSLYNIILMVITFLLFFFFVYTTITQGISFARQDQLKLKKRKKKKKAGRN